MRSKARRVAGEFADSSPERNKWRRPERCPGTPGSPGIRDENGRRVLMRIGRSTADTTVPEYPIDRASTSRKILEALYYVPAAILCSTIIFRHLTDLYRAFIDYDDLKTRR